MKKSLGFFADLSRIRTIQEPIMAMSARILGALLIFAPIPVLAHSFTKGDITIGHPWARATAEGATVGVGYVKITNTGKAADRLTGGSFEGSGALEIHEMKMDGEIMKMRQLTEGFEIAPGAIIELKPGGNHLMFTGLKKQVVEGPKLKGSLTFEKAGTIDVEFAIEPIGAAESVDHNH